MTEKKNIYIYKYKYIWNIFFIYFFILYIYLLFFIIIFRYAIAYLRTGSYAPGVNIRMNLQHNSIALEQLY